jgi:asparaginyl-tRNA synthetase
MRDAEIRELPGLVGEEVRVSGWLYNARSSGKLRFLVVRDGSGYLQAVVFKPGAPESVWAEAERATQESSLRVVGKVKEEKRAPGGVELQVEALEIVQLCPEYPITPKEHGPDFLLNNRHLWLRSKRQHAVMRVRNELTFGIREFFYRRNYVQIDSPILTPAAARAPQRSSRPTTSGRRPTSRSRASSTSSRRPRTGRSTASGRRSAPRSRRRGATCGVLDGRARGRLPARSRGSWTSPRSSSRSSRGARDRALQRGPRSGSSATSRSSSRRAKRFPRIDYARGRREAQGQGLPVQFGDDLGGDEETALADGSTRRSWSRATRRDQGVLHAAGPERPRRRARPRHARPEGYGEIIGGSQRIHDHDLLLRAIGRSTTCRSRRLPVVPRRAQVRLCSGPTASVVTHADLVVSRLVRARATLAMIVATDAVHTNGFGRWL